MTAELRCDEVRELAPELALGVADGAQRHAALRHVVGCAECSRFVAELTETCDALVLLAPNAEPPAGFEQSVLERLRLDTGDDAPSIRGRGRWRTVMAVAAVVVATALGAGSMFVATRTDREVAAAYRDVLARGAGSFFAVASVDDAGGHIGTAWGYQGDPSWVVVALPHANASARRYRASATGKDGRTYDLGAAVLGCGHAAWSAALPIPLSDLQQVTLDGRRANDLTAYFTQVNDPWG
jgi:hypothetical protein